MIFVHLFYYDHGLVFYYYHILTTFLFFFFKMIRPPPRSTLFPYTPLSRPADHEPRPRQQVDREPRRAGQGEDDAQTADRHLPAGRRDQRGAGAGQHQRADRPRRRTGAEDRKSTRLNSSHLVISYAVFCLKK